MEIYKKGNKIIEIMGGLTWKQTWTLGIQIHCSWITTKEMPELTVNNLFFGVHFLCFDVSFEYWWGI